MADLQWTEASWLEAAHAWILAELKRLGLALAGPIEQPHVRGWSTVLRVPTGDGDVWFKANMPALAREAAIVSVLVRRAPALVPELLATDLERGWMLQADGGTRLRESGLDAGCWEEILPLYAELQLDLAVEREELLAAGAPDRRLATLPALYEQLVAEEAEELRALTPRVAELCGELAGLGLPETIQHDDLHDGQIFVRDGHYRFFDWAEACVSHPFFTMTVTLAPGLERFRDAYLEPWTRIAPRGELETAFPTALVLGGICRAVTWRKVVDEMPEPYAAEWADAVPGRLRALLAAL